MTFSPARSSSTWPLLRSAGRFTVNILPVEHQQLAGQFARSGTDKFAGVDYSASPLGNPVLDQALAWVDCGLHEEYDGGDHTIVVADAHALGAREGAEPLLFLRAATSKACRPGPNCWTASHDAGQVGLVEAASSRPPAPARPPCPEGSTRIGSSITH